VRNAVFRGLEPVLHFRGDFGRDVLNQCAARRDVQHLRAAADRQKRQVRVEGTPREVDLELIAPRLGVVHGRVPLLSIEDGVDIASAGQQYAVDFLQDRSRALGHLEHAGRPARQFD
jgi:hypothetical protein